MSDVVWCEPEELSFGEFLQVTIMEVNTGRHWCGPPIFPGDTYVGPSCLCTRDDSDYLHGLA